MIIKKLFILILTFSVLIGCGKKVEESSDPKNSGVSENGINGQVDNIAKKRIELLNALVSDDLNLVKQGISDNPDLVFRFEDGESPLTKAIKVSKSEVIQVLIVTSQAINYSNERGEIPLNLIIKSANLSRDKKLDLVKMMIKKNAKINNKNAKGVTPLVSSILFNLEKIALTLVKRGAKVKVSGISRLTPLQLAKRHGHDKLAKLIHLVIGHKDINKTVLINAMDNSEINFIQYLLTNYPEYINLIDSENLLSRVLRLSNKETRLGLLSYFLSQGVAVDGISETTPLMVASSLPYDGAISEVAKLIRNNAGLIKRSRYGSTALMMAVQKLNSRIVDRLYNAILRKRDSASQADTYMYQVVLDEACNFLPTSNQARTIRDDGFLYRNLIKSKLGCF
jgi:ankyrin repeat protein